MVLYSVIIIIIIIITIIFFCPGTSFPRVLKLAKVKMYVRNGYDGDSETVNVLARYTVLKRWIATEIRITIIIIRISIEDVVHLLEYCHAACFDWM